METFGNLTALNENSFGLDLGLDGFDINAAFMNALEGLASDEDIAMEEKVSRMGMIVSEGQSPIYNDFVDLLAMAAQIEMICSHDHELQNQLLGQEAISSFIDNHSHDHTKSSIEKKDHKKKKGKKESVTSRHLFAYLFGKK